MESIFIWRNCFIWVTKTRYTTTSLLLYLSQLNYFIYLSQLINGNEIKKCKVYNMSRVRPVSNHHRHYHATRHSNTAPPRQLIKRHVITLRVSDQSSTHWVTSLPPRSASNSVTETQSDEAETLGFLSLLSILVNDNTRLIGDRNDVDELDSPATNLSESLSLLPTVTPT
jgi:hypothetical protein